MYKNSTRTLAAILFTLGCLAPASASAATLTLNFDSISLPLQACTDGTAYLASFGIGFASVTGGAAPRICNVVGTAATASSPDNVFFALPAVTNTNESYDLLFSTPLVGLSFTRAAAAPNTSLPAWNAFAFDAANNLLDSIAEPSIFPGPPAATFALDGPGISRVRIESFNAAGRTFNHPPFDDLIITTADTAAIPEPGTNVLLATGLGVMILKARRRFRR